MQNHRFLRDANDNVLAVVTLTLAAILGTIGVAIGDDSFDSAQVAAVVSAHATAADAKDTRFVAGRDAASVHGSGASSTSASTQTRDRQRRIERTVGDPWAAAD